MTPELRQKLGERGVLGACLELHMMNTGSADGDQSTVSDTRTLLREVLRSWTESTREESRNFDECVRQLVIAVLSEKHWTEKTPRSMPETPEPNTYRIVKCDNFDRDNVPDCVVAENLSKFYAEQICTLLNGRFGGTDAADFFKAVPLTYKLKTVDF